MKEQEFSLVKPEAGGLLGLLRQDTAIPDLPEPYARDIMLLDTIIAGTSHVVGIEELEPYLRVGDRLTLYRIPDNPSDPNAIKIFNRDGLKLGYVPRQDNPILARLMDGGKHLYATIQEKSWREGWLRIGIRVFLADE